MIWKGPPFFEMDENFIVCPMSFNYLYYNVNGRTISLLDRCAHKYLIWKLDDDIFFDLERRVL